MLRYYESKKIVDAYAEYRPPYSSEIADAVMKYHGEKSTSNGEKLELMVDVGCGNGLVCNIFQNYFKKIIGIDVSPEQLKSATNQNKFDNVTYEIGTAEKIPVPDASVDLITAGIAAHWFDLPNFFKEAERVLKPNGSMALFSFTVPKISSLLEENDGLAIESGKVFNQMMFLGMPEDTAERNSCMESALRYPNIYKAIPFSPKERNDDIHALLECTMGEICGMVRSTNCYETFMRKKMEEMEKANQDITQEKVKAIDLALAFAKKLKEMWKIDDSMPNDQKIMKVDFHYCLLLARR